MVYYLGTFFCILITSIKHRKNLLFLGLNISIFFYYILIPISWKILVINSYFPVYVIKGIQNLKNFDRIGFYIFLFYLSLLLGYTVKKEKNRGKSKTKKIEKIAFLFY